MMNRRVARTSLSDRVQLIASLVVVPPKRLFQMRHLAATTAADSFFGHTKHLIVVVMGGPSIGGREKIVRSLVDHMQVDRSLLAAIRT